MLDGRPSGPMPFSVSALASIIHATGRRRTITGRSSRATLLHDRMLIGTCIEPARMFGSSGERGVLEAFEEKGGESPREARADHTSRSEDKSGFLGRVLWMWMIVGATGWFGRVEKRGLKCSARESRNGPGMVSVRGPTR